MSSELDTIELIGGRMLKVHRASECAGEVCSVHNPSAHHMVTWPRDWTSHNYAMWRVCSHGVRHIDPDHAAYVRTAGIFAGDSCGPNCDGCCQPPDEGSEGPRDPVEYLAWVRDQIAKAGLTDTTP